MSLKSIDLDKSFTVKAALELTDIVCDKLKNSTAYEANKFMPWWWAFIHRWKELDRR